MGVVDGNRPASDNEWEEVTKGGDAAIKRWIDGQLRGKSVAIVLIGAKTAGRRWVNYEIEKAWNDHKAILGIYIHNLKNRNGNQSAKGSNPFSAFTVGGKNLSNIAMTYDPPYTRSERVYNHIKDNLADWIEKAIEIRGEYA